MSESMNSLVEFARQIRIKAIEMTSSGGSSHVGSTLSCADILAFLYGNLLDIDPASVAAPDRDRFILSKGHAGVGVYAALALKGFFPVEQLANHYQNGSIFSGHISHAVPGVEFSTGSLGHGLSVSAGLALACSRRRFENKVVCLLSDGELDEGSNWEAILFASHHKLANLVAIIDYNKLQSLESCEATLGLEPLKDKWLAFGWEVLEVDGHCFNSLSRISALVGNGKPLCVIAHTTKGKGVSFMENSVLWHYRTPAGFERQAALKELGQS